MSIEPTMLSTHGKRVPGKWAPPCTGVSQWCEELKLQVLLSHPPVMILLVFGGQEDNISVPYRTPYLYRYLQPDAAPGLPIQLWTPTLGIKPKAETGLGSASPSRHPFLHSWQPVWGAEGAEAVGLSGIRISWHHHSPGFTCSPDRTLNSFSLVWLRMYIWGVGWAHPEMLRGHSWRKLGRVHGIPGINEVSLLQGKLIYVAPAQVWTVVQDFSERKTPKVRAPQKGQLPTVSMTSHSILGGCFRSLVFFHLP